MLLALKQPSVPTTSLQLVLRRRGKYNLKSHDCVLCTLLCREWLETLRVVRVMSAEKIKRIMEREVDPRNALGSIDLDNIDQVVAADQTKRCVCTSSISIDN